MTSMSDFRAKAKEMGLKLWRAESLNNSAILIEAIAEVITGKYKADVDEVVVA